MTYSILRPLVLSLLATYLIGCASLKAIPKPVDIVGELRTEREESQKLPVQPDACSRPVKVNIKTGDRLDAALVRTFGALKQSNTEKLSCAAWYDTLRRARAGGGE